MRPIHRLGVVCGVLVAAALLCFSAIFTSHAAGAADFDRKAWQEDYTYLKSALEQNYANLAWLGSPQGGVDLPALDLRTQRALDQAETDKDARAAILAFVAGFHDGHFSRLASIRPGEPVIANAAPPTPGNADAVADCTALGYTATTTAPFSLPLESLSGFRLETDVMPQVFRAGVFTNAQGSRLGIVRIQQFDPRDYPALCVQVWATIKQSGKLVETRALRQGIRTKWFEALAALLRKFQSERVNAVIVDVGDNSGGGDEGDWTPRLFSDGPVHSARLLMAAAPAASAYFDEQLSDLHKAVDGRANSNPELVSAAKSAVSVFQKRKAAIGSMICDMSWAWREQREWNPSGCSRLIEAGFASGAVNYMAVSSVSDRDLASSVYWPAIVDPYRGSWSGPVYVLTDGKTYSAAEMFAAVMHDNGIAKLVGSRTGGDGCGFMHNDPPTVLPHSQLRFRVPDCVRLRADGTDEVAGIQPDLVVQRTEGEDGEALALRIFDAIRENLRTKGGNH
jgi:hypothetical protein